MLRRWLRCRSRFRILPNSRMSSLKPERPLPMASKTARLFRTFWTKAWSVWTLTVRFALSRAWTAPRDRASSKTKTSEELEKEARFEILFKINFLTLMS